MTPGELRIRLVGRTIVNVEISDCGDVSLQLDKGFSVVFGEAREPAGASGRYLTTGDAARLIGVSCETIRLWNFLGKLPAIRTESGQRLFTREAVIQRRAAKGRR